MTSVFDLPVAQYGIDRGLGGGNVARPTTTPTSPTPRPGRQKTGVKAADIERTGREFAENAAEDKGKSMIIMGAAINHWYHNDLRPTVAAIIEPAAHVRLRRSDRRRLAHYVGPGEKLRPQTGWAPIAFALDWHRPPRHELDLAHWYFHTDQWRY